MTFGPDPKVGVLSPTRRPNTVNPDHLESFLYPKQTWDLNPYTTLRVEVALNPLMELLPMVLRRFHGLSMGLNSPVLVLSDKLRTSS